MKVAVNGEIRELPEGQTVTELLASLHLLPRNVAIELNRRLLRAQNYQTALRERDSLEIVTFVGGG